MNKVLSAFCLILVGASLAVANAAQEDSAYMPSSRLFSCVLPDGWRVFEEKGGTLVHLLGPDDSAGNYRTGIDIEWMESGQPGFIPYKDQIDKMRNAAGGVKMDATPVEALRISGQLGRTFELTETRQLPTDALPASPEILHHFVAFVPNGQSYYLIRLSSSREVYLDYRKVFLNFLRTFKSSGAL